jgi:16S rRNA processing protein RimM
MRFFAKNSILKIHGVNLNVKEFLEVGKVISVFGIIGEVVVSPMCDSPETIISLKRIFCGNAKTPINIISGFVRKTNAVIKLEGINTPESAHTYIGKILYLKRDDIKLPEGTYFYADLLGIEVRDYDTGMVYGEISEITDNGAHEIYHVKSPKGRINLIPAVSEFIKNTDTIERIMLIKTVEGLIEADED